MSDQQREPTIGEVYRLQLHLQASVDSLRDEMKHERHALRNEMQAIVVEQARIGIRISMLETARRDMSGWIAGAVSGASIAAFEWFLTWFLKR